MHRRTIHLLLAALFVASCVAADQPASPGEHPDQETIERQAGTYPELPPSKVPNVVMLRIEKNDLTLMTLVPPTLGPARIKLSDLPGLSTVNIHSNGVHPAGVPYSPEVFNFEHSDFSIPGATASTAVSQTGWNLQVSEIVESQTDIKQISLVQAPGDGPDGNVGIHLRVSVQNNSGDPPSINIDRTATDFVTLRRLYPGDVAAYLVPIFRDLHADAEVFRADHKLALEVFAAEAPSDPQVNDKVKQLVVQLDADDFHTRENAATQLQKLGQPAAICLSRMNRAGLSPEQNSRVDAILSSYRPVPQEDAQQLGHDVNFLIDCLYDTDDFIAGTAKARLQKIVGRPIAFDLSLRDEARRSAIAKLRSEITSAATQPSTEK